MRKKGENELYRENKEKSDRKTAKRDQLEMGNARSEKDWNNNNLKQGVFIKLLPVCELW